MREEREAEVARMRLQNAGAEAAADAAARAAYAAARAAADAAAIRAAEEHMNWLCENWRLLTLVNDRPRHCFV